MIVGIEQIEMYGYIISTESEFTVDLPQDMIDEVDATFTAYLAAQVRLTDIIESSQQPEAEVVAANTRWCTECANITAPDGESCSVCGFLYVVTATEETPL